MSKLVINPLVSGFPSVATLNANFEAIEAALENTVSRDGTTPNHLTADLDMNGHRILNVLASTGEGFIWRGTWTTGLDYTLNDLVYSSGSSYICTISHTATVFGTDLGAGKWQIIAAKGESGDGTGDMLKADNLAGLVSAETARANIGAAASGANSDITSLTGTFTTPLSISRGGTGGNSEAAAKAALNLEIGIDVMAHVAPGTNGNVLTSNGTSWTSAAPSPALIKQIVTTTIAASSGTTTIPYDNTSPLSTEGTQVASASITTATASNKVRVRASFVFKAIEGENLVAALFRGTTCIGAAMMQGGIATIEVMDSPASASSHTYSLRVGGIGGSSIWSVSSNTVTLGGEPAKMIMSLEEISA